ncbi:MAG: thioredoxin family protein [Acidobacteria bacterium]|nr:thioredoxin family protein [Planctomycetota bacterium]MBE3133593.1 thioredoxin family protein [Acidobacteriota bacterium]
MSGLVLSAAVAAAVSAGCQQAGRANVTYAATGLPRLVDIGASACLPCIMMAPSLEELKKEYAGRLQIEFIDAFQNPGAKKQYDAFFCPTQVFIDASGKELFRHTGYYSKKNILAKWRELGVDLEAPPERPDAPESAVQPKTGGG